MNATYTTSRLNNCGSGLVGHKEGPGGIVRGGGTRLSVGLYLYISVWFVT